MVMWRVRRRDEQLVQTMHMCQTSPFGKQLYSTCIPNYAFHTSMLLVARRQTLA